MATERTQTAPGDLYNERTLTRALKSLGHYVYGYYEPEKIEPFYVGKGQGNRVLSHWKNACANNEKHKQYEAIRKILNSGKIPTVKILAHNLENTTGEDVYSVVERVLQNTFGIDRPDDRVFESRLKFKQEATLIQDRNDGKEHPILSLEAAYCKGAFGTSKVLRPEQIVSECKAPMLLVGLSGSYHPNYSQTDLSQMARMYWNLDLAHLQKKFRALQDADSAVLAGWTSKFGGPQIAGIWRIKKGSFAHSPKENSERYECSVVDDFGLRKSLLGTRLSGNGGEYFGPHIYLAD